MESTQQPHEITEFIESAKSSLDMYVPLEQPNRRINIIMDRRILNYALETFYENFIGPNVPEEAIKAISAEIAKILGQANKEGLIYVWSVSRSKYVRPITIIGLFNKKNQPLLDFESSVPGKVSSYPLFNSADFGEVAAILEQTKVQRDVEINAEIGEIEDQEYIDDIVDYITQHHGKFTINNVEGNILMSTPVREYLDIMLGDFMNKNIPYDTRRRIGLKLSDDLEEANKKGLIYVWSETNRRYQRPDKIINITLLQGVKPVLTVRNIKNQLREHSLSQVLAFATIASFREEEDQRRKQERLLEITREKLANQERYI